jgi:ferrous-iron efflux pump FieF
VGLSGVTAPAGDAMTALPFEGAAATRRVAMLSVAMATMLALLKLGGWIASGSVGLLASLADSALDIVAAFGVLTAVRVAVTPPDAEHRFGHGKAEGFASLLQAVLVIVSAVLIGREAVNRIVSPVVPRVEGVAMAILAFSTVMAGVLVVLQGRALAKTRSVAVESDRLHYLADIASNLAAFAGVAVALLFHAPRADAVAGLVVSAWLAWGAVGMSRGAVRNLMDHELDEDERGAIVALIREDPLLLGVQDLRTRASGPIVHIQAHVAMAPSTTVESAHHLLVQAERRLVARFPSADILLHPDPFGCAEDHVGAFAEAVRLGGLAEPSGDAPAQVTPPRAAVRT